MADNTVLNPGTGGSTVRDLEDGSSIHWPVCVEAFATTVSAGANVVTIQVAAALADGVSNPTSTIRGVCLLGFNGTTWDRLRSTTTNGLDVDVTRLPAITPGATSLTEASISASSSGDNTLVAGTGGQTIKVYRLFLVVATAVDIYFRDGTAGTAYSGAMTMKSGGSVVLDFTGDPWFTTSDGENLVLNLSAAVQASGRVYYVKD